MLDKKYVNNEDRKNYLWSNDKIEMVFPNAINISNNKRMKLTAIKDELKGFLNVRNRVFHHEPIWKGKNQKTRINTAVENIIRNYDSIFKILKYINSDFESILREYGYRENFIGKVNVEFIKNKKNDIAKFLDK
ncbi:hypothetical protein LGZ99_02950 [Photorhabdus temperata]|uniref:Abi-like protein n=1 Tax=Photorhabdus temperata subsp. temperata Meg1 TaxID=1393735 RepID=A0A081RU35_PHOTE|nr:hypothetical protein [Photorhabdus temperata]KER02188.1 hypothetical protein MEG1DRAFT_03186 [Photorhabdus temperata subsp. temperata Meg1]MCT8346197.1 hypothetical protein [Photorhabdus temperata]